MTRQTFFDLASAISARSMALNTDDLALRRTWWQSNTLPSHSTCTSAKSLELKTDSRSRLSCFCCLCFGFKLRMVSSGYLEPESVLSAPIMETSQTMVRVSFGSHWDDLLFRMLVSMNFLKPQESGFCLNCVNVDWQTLISKVGQTNYSHLDSVLFVLAGVKDGELVACLHFRVSLVGEVDTEVS